MFQGDVFLGRKCSSSLFPSLSGLGKAHTFGAGDALPSVSWREPWYERHDEPRSMGVCPLAPRPPAGVFQASQVTRGHVVCL